MEHATRMLSHVRVRIADQQMARKISDVLPEDPAPKRRERFDRWNRKQLMVDGVNAQFRSVAGQ